MSGGGSTCPSTHRGDVWQIWETSKCGNNPRALCIPTSVSGVGMCSCEYDYGLWVDREDGSCGLSRGTKVYAAMWCVMGVMGALLLVRTVSVIGVGIRSRLLTTIVIKSTAALCFTANVAHMIGAILEAANLLVPDHDYKSLRVAFIIFQSIGLVSIIGALNLLGASTLLIMIRSSKLARTSRFDRRNIFIFTGVSSLVSLALVGGFAAKRQQGPVGMATAFAFLISWIMFRVAIYMAPVQTRFTSSSPAQQSLAAAVAAIDHVGWPVIISCIITVPYAAVWAVGHKYANKSCLRYGMAVLAYVCYFMGIPIIFAITRGLRLVFAARLKTSTNPSQRFDNVTVAALANPTATIPETLEVPLRGVSVETAASGAYAVALFPNATKSQDDISFDIADIKGTDSESPDVAATSAQRIPPQ